ncbi:MAG: MmgE/PrpD family protein [Alphaproteobacteria bacterium]|jgi:2-methylcitrate dehydratase PrpD|nr:MmgE/PrpD family protein [Alphaproteobacteria bacterium]
MTATETSNAIEAARFVGAAKGRNYPGEIVDAARMCLVDWAGVAIGAESEGAGRAVRQVVAAWGTAGNACVLLGRPMAPTAAALINGTMAHCLDYDDTHVGSVAHISGPTWAAALAVGTHLGAGEQDIVSAFITGFEVGARLGGGGLGQAVSRRGFHSTGIVGCLAAATASAVLMGLDEDGIVRALGAAATQTGGLTASFGTMSKPFHAGKAALNGVLAAELAAAGFEPARGLIEPGDGLAKAVVQDGVATVPTLDFSDGWEITRNTFKPYASCLLTHPVIDAARSLSGEVEGREIAAVEAVVHPMAIELAGKTAPTTGLEGKFSIAYCAALGLNGYPATFVDFSDERLTDEAVRTTTDRVEYVATEDMATTAARMVVRFADGAELDADVPLALGNPGNPMSWADMEEKFMALVSPVMGESASELFAVLRNFDEAGRLDALVELVGRD